MKKNYLSDIISRIGKIKLSKRSYEANDLPKELLINLSKETNDINKLALKLSCNRRNFTAPIICEQLFLNRNHVKKTKENSPKLLINISNRNNKWNKMAIKFSQNKRASNVLTNLISNKATTKK